MPPRHLPPFAGPLARRMTTPPDDAGVLNRRVCRWVLSRPLPGPAGRGTPEYRVPIRLPRKGGLRPEQGQTRQRRWQMHDWPGTALVRQAHRHASGEHAVVQLGFHSLVAGWQVEGDPAMHGVAGVDVVQPCAVLAVGSSKIYVG